MQTGLTDGSARVDLVQMVNGVGVLTGLLIVLATWFAVRVATGTFARLGDRFVHRRLLLNQLATLARFVLYLAGFGLALSVSVRLSHEIILGLTGTLAVTAGFALKDLAASVIAGIIIIVDKPFQVGDRVSFGGNYGEIREIGLRSVRLVTLDDCTVTIPNNKFLTDVVSSGNSGTLVMLVPMDFYVAVDQDVALAKRLVAEAVTSNPYAYLGKPWTVLVSQVVHEHYFAVRLRAKAYVLDVTYEKAFETDVTERVLEAFRAHAILPPAVLHRSTLAVQADAASAHTLRVASSS